MCFTSTGWVISRDVTRSHSAKCRRLQIFTQGGACVQPNRADSQSDPPCEDGA